MIRSQVSVNMPVECCAGDRSSVVAMVVSRNVFGK